MARYSRRRSSRRRSTRKQRGGDGFAFSSAAFTTTGGVPIENRGAYSHCESDFRVAPAIGTQTLWGGGSRKKRGRKQKKQRGGGCGCMASSPLMTGGGAGTGGYSLVFDNNSLGKTYSAIDKPACPQTGGSSIYEQVAYPASYGYDQNSAYLSSSAHFLEPVRDVSRCASGGARRRRTVRATRR